MYWGELYVIPQRVFWDVATLVAWTVAVFLPARQWQHALCLLASSMVGVYLTADGSWTNRWTLSLPMIPLLLLQSTRYVPAAGSSSAIRNHKFPDKQDTVLSSTSSVTSSNGENMKARKRLPWSTYLIGSASLLCIFAGTVFSTLFSPLQLPPLYHAFPKEAITSSLSYRLQPPPYQVGVMDFFLNVTGFQPPHAPICMVAQADPHHASSPNQIQCRSVEDHLPVRLIYPTSMAQIDSRSAWRIWFGASADNFLPYVPVQYAIDYCRHMMQFGAPPPLKKFDWMLHYWRLMQLGPVYPRAPLLAIDENKPQHLFPLVVFSHGLAGTAVQYSYLTMSLAAHGYVVLVLNHLDGSAPVVQRHPSGNNVDVGSSPPPPVVVQHYDYDISRKWFEGDYNEYARARRQQTEFRAAEMIAATRALLHWSRRAQNGGVATNHQHDNTHLASILTGRLNPDEVVLAGHSFGGVTALTAAKRDPTLALAVVAHDPAGDWLPDDVRWSLWHTPQNQYLTPDEIAGFNYTGGPAGYDPEKVEAHSQDASMLHHHMMVLYSGEWDSLPLSAIRLMKHLYETGILNGTHPLAQDALPRCSHVGVVHQARHNEFSDASMLTPLWLARGVGITSKERSPVDIAQEVIGRTLGYLDTVRKHRKRQQLFPESQLWRQ